MPKTATRRYANPKNPADWSSISRSISKQMSSMNQKKKK